MRIVSADVADRRRLGRPPRVARAARLEALGLTVSTFVVSLGVCLAAWGSLQPPGAPPLGAHATPDPLQLRGASSAAAIEPHLGAIPAGRARRDVAASIHRHATDPDRPLTHVGALASLRDAQGRAVLSRAALADFKPHVAVRTVSEFAWALARAAGSMLAAFWVAHAIRRWRGAVDDPVLLPLLLLLCGVGLMSMVALRDPLRDTLVAATFAGGVCTGLLALLGASEIDYESSPLRRAVLAPLAIAVLLAVALLVFGTGPGSSDVKVNLLGIQPVEAVRLLVVAAMAAAVARRLEQIRALSEPATPARRWLALVRVPRWRDVRAVVASMALVLAFFFLQKDLGPALVLSGVVIALYATARGHVASVAVGGAMLVAAFGVAYAVGFPATVGHRVRIWADPWNTGVIGGSQVAHGFWAMATGSVLGSGPGRGMPQAIPEAHTDFVLAAIGEELGFVGLLAVVALYAVLTWRCLRIALRAPGDYSALLGLGVALGLVVQALVMAGGLLGLLPLTGVVTPFLSYGRSAMLANCAAVGVVLAIARRSGPVRRPLLRPVQVLGGVLAVCAVGIAARTAWVQVVRADAIATAASLGLQADGGHRFEYNPRLVAAARAIERGSIVDRHGLVLATSRPAEIAGVSAAYRQAGVTPVLPCAPSTRRCYPLGGQAFSLVGDWARQVNWGARNTSYLERDTDATLSGFDDRQRIVEVVHPRTGARERIARRDYGALLPIARHGIASTRAEVRALLERPRDVRSTIDARLQQRAARALEAGITRGRHARGAAVVIDVASGDVLASVSYPWPAPGDFDARSSLVPPQGNAGRATTVAERARAAEALLDRVRYGLYPPGSTFKLLVAAAVLRHRPDAGAATFACARLPGGRVGHAIRGWARPVRDDVMDTQPHGAVDLHEGLVVSCNAYFAQLAQHLGPRPILDAVSTFQIDVARPSSAAALRHTLPHAGYGQGDVLASPLKMARVAAAIASGGEARPARWTMAPDVDGGLPDDATPFLAEADAARLGAYMREAVTQGTGRIVAGNRTPIAGKTGTAEVDDAPSHSWFVGFAPYGGTRPIAFAVIVEHAGYGARSAAPVAGAIVDAARELGVLDRRPANPPVTARRDPTEASWTSHD